MKRTKVLLLFLTFLPILYLLFIYSLNTSKKVNIRLLTYNLPETNIGILIAITSTAGYFISTSSILLSLHKKNNYNKKIFRDETYEEVNEEYSNPSKVEEFETNIDYIDRAPIRSPKDPAPTISVPFRIISRSNLRNKIQNENYKEFNYDSENYSYYNSKANQFQEDNEKKTNTKNVQKSEINEDWDFALDLDENW